MSLILFKVIQFLSMQTTNQNDEDLNLELSLGPPLSPLPPPPPLPPPQQPDSFIFPLLLTSPPPEIPHPFTSSHNLSSTSTPIDQPSINSQPNSGRRKRKWKDTSIEPPYPWSTVRPAIVHNLDYLLSNGIVTITGDVKCNRCEEKYIMKYDLEEKFNELGIFIASNWDILHDRAPSCWQEPSLLDCKICRQKNCVRPVIPENDDKNINWLFLLLGQFLGCLKHEQLKYFCACTRNHRTGAKNRLLYLTYLVLCNQLQPSNTLFRR